MSGLCRAEGSPSDPMATWGWHGDDVISARRLIHCSKSMIVEDSRRCASDPIGKGFADRVQIAVPYYGAFAWTVGSASRIADANSVLLISRDQEFCETHPCSRVGHASAIFTPAATLVEEAMVCTNGGRSAFDAVTIPISDVVRFAVHNMMVDQHLTPLAIEESALWVIQSVFKTKNIAADQKGHAIVRRAKEVLYEAGSRPVSLDEVAVQVGVSAIYLTQCFSRNEGMPLYRYQMRLRLSRALYELPRCGNLTELALDLGFSSHAHFTSTFRSAFGMTPSAFRAERRGRCFPAAA